MKDEARHFKDEAKSRRRTKLHFAWQTRTFFILHVPVSSQLVSINGALIVPSSP